MGNYFYNQTSMVVNITYQNKDSNSNTVNIYPLQTETFPCNASTKINYGYSLQGVTVNANYFRMYYDPLGLKSVPSNNGVYDTSACTAYYIARAAGSGI